MLACLHGASKINSIWMVSVIVRVYSMWSFIGHTYTLSLGRTFLFGYYTDTTPSVQNRNCTHIRDTFMQVIQ